MMVMMNWMWNWIMNSRDARLITGEVELDIVDPPDEIEAIQESRSHSTISVHSS
jgi:hypothetical protein